MIVDKLENAAMYVGLHKNFKTALEFVQCTNLNAFELGRHEIQGDEIIALISEYTTKSDTSGQLEGHKKYIDLQCLIQGEEKIGFATYKGQSPVKGCDLTDDYWLFKEEYSMFKLEQGTFAILFPDDLHLPGIKIDESKKVKKLVIKIKI